MARPGYLSRVDAAAPFDTGLRLEDQDQDRPQPIDTPWGQFALFPGTQGWVAIDCWCPHMQGPLYEGTFSAGELVCPWHGWRYETTDGRCTWAPEAKDRESRVRTLVVEVGPAGTVILHPPAE